MYREAARYTKRIKKPSNEIKFLRGLNDSIFSYLKSQAQRKLLPPELQDCTDGQMKPLPQPADTTDSLGRGLAFI